MPDSLGFRKRIGIVVPSTNTTVQPECENLRPHGVTNHVARSTIKERPLNTEHAFFEHMQDMREGIGIAIDQIMTAGPDHLILGIALETFWGGVAAAAKFQLELSQRAGIGVSMGSAASVSALNAFGAKRIAVLTPHQPRGDDMWCIQCAGPNLEAAMTAAGTYLARSIGLLILPAFIVVYFAIPSAPAQQRPGLEVIEFNGTVAAAREAEVAPRLEGLLSKIDFSAGQLVKQGDLLFEFAPKYNELKLALAQATLKQVEAELQLAEVKLKNKQTLRTRNVGSEMEFLESQAQRDIAAAKVEEARANVGLAEEDLKKMKLYAPISGIISRPLIKEGAYITDWARDQSLATIAQLDPINVIGRPPADKYFQRTEKLTSMEQVAERREFGLILPTGEKYPLKGHLIGGAYEFNPATQTTEVIVEFPNPDYLLRPGLNVTLQSSIREN